MSKQLSRSRRRKKVEKRYKKTDHHNHILDRPNMYIGANKVDNYDMWILDEEIDKIILKNIRFNPAMYKTFDELIVNARDHIIRDRTCKTIKVWIDKDEGIISVYNDGEDGVPIVIHEEENIYVPELIFGNLLTSENYNDDEERIVGGTNGLGG
jgi:DNA topoisomerase-2